MLIDDAYVLTNILVPHVCSNLFSNLRSSLIVFIHVVANGASNV